LAKLDSKPAIVTVAGRAVGKGIALRFGQEEAKVVVTSRTEQAVDDGEWITGQVIAVDGGSMMR
jgi:NAD(P)-dependent dehydrogenase (short-subunit alcohol dehydrogenase family)